MERTQTDVLALILQERELRESHEQNYSAFHLTSCPLGHFVYLAQKVLYAFLVK